MSLRAEQIETALDAVGIPHDEMRFLQESNNVSFTDGNVFVKATRPGFSSDQLQTELSLALFYGPEHMLTPTYATLVEADGFFMSVWKYEHLTQLHPKTVTAATAAALAGKLNLLHQLPQPNFNIGSMKDFSRMKETIEKRVAYGRETGLEREFTNLMLKLSEAFLNETLAADGFVFSHGDCHMGNAAVQDDSAPIWLDFESARLAPPEFDAATLRVNLLLLGGNETAWDAAEPVLQAVGLRTEMMELFTRSRLISMTSYIMLLPERHDIARERLRLLAPLLEGGPLPNRFPNER